MCGYVSIPLSSLLSSWLTKFRSLFTNSLPSNSQSGGICGDPHLTAIGKVLLSGSLPFLVAFAMVVILLLSFTFSFAFKCRQHPGWRKPASTETPLTEQLVEAASELESNDRDYGNRNVVDEWLPSNSCDRPGANDMSLNQSSTLRLAVSPSHLEDVQVGGGRLRSKYIAAGLNFFLSVYSSFLVTVVAMLHCVDVPGRPRALFIHGSLECDYTGWQLPFVIAAVLLAAVPVVIPLLTSWAVSHQHKHHLVIQSDGYASVQTNSWKDDFCVGVILAFVTPYDSSMSWWEAVMVLHRLGLAFLYTFASSLAAIQSLLSILMCVTFLTLHLYRQPFRRPDSQALQTIFLFCLTVVSVMRNVSSSILDTAATGSERPLTVDFCEGVTLLFEYIIPFIALPLAFYLA